MSPDELDDWSDDGFDDNAGFDAQAGRADGKTDTIKPESILDVPVRAVIQAGRTRLPLRTLLRLTKGSLVELDRSVDEPMDVLINGALVARGEVVVVNGEYALRIVRIFDTDSDSGA